jgi:uncharacterized protein
MIIGVCRLELSLPMAHSLKDKRQVVKSVIARLRNNFNLSIAEVDDLDVHQRAVIGMCGVSTDAAYIHGLFEKAVKSVEESRLDCDILDYHIDLLP